ncbi:MAG: hypothetical protein ACHQUC_00055 [Chlamydiales bacterium]
MTNFKVNLMLSLKLESEGKEVEFPSKMPTGYIESIHYLHLHSYGYECHLQFRAFDHDDLEEMINSPKILKATLTFKPTEEEQGTNPILELKGAVTYRTRTRVNSNLKENKADRIYSIKFCDFAKATWEQHYPSNIYLEESMKEIIEKHVNPDVAMKFDWDLVEIKHPITAFSLKYKQANFYSFLNWYLHQENGILLYDYKAHSYTITGKKKELEGEPLEVDELTCNPPVCYFPHPPRYNGKVIKHSADEMDGEDKENEDSFKAMRRELIDPANYRVYPEQADEEVQSIDTRQKNLVELELTEVSNKIHLDKLTPGSYLCFKRYKSDSWTDEASFKDKKFRIRNLDFSATKDSQSEPNYRKIDPYYLSIRIILEEAEETFVERPNFVPPTFPFYIQGKVFCDIGEEEQSTFKILESEEAPQGQYQILVPLAGEEKKVVAPFVPAYSGQYYYPFIKDTKVMLSMHFRTAHIERPIDWDPLARLPAGIQGNQIVLASNGKDKYTIIKHEYLDGKDSIYTIKQSSSEEQTQTIEIKEKEITITMDEKNKKTVFIQLSHESGLTLSLEDKDAGSKQQVVFDGESMTHTCKGSDGTSTIVQKPDSITIECKEFSVKSETILLDAKDSISQTGKNKVNIKTNVANVSAPSVKLG